MEMARGDDDISLCSAAGIPYFSVCARLRYAAIWRVEHEVHRQVQPRVVVA